ncbi:MAG: hypothetical protein CMO55_14795 [Verrucomicrobiales bacterium]|nr:hypothetical protein [Verrucomicrobiales bacterium]
MNYRYSIANYIWHLNGHPVYGMPMAYLDPDRLRHPDAAVDAYDDDLPVLVGRKFRTVVSLVNRRQQRVLENAGFEFHAVLIPDGEAPTLLQVEEYRKIVEACPKPMVVHCEGGVGRTGTMLALYLIFQGVENAEAIRQVRKSLPTAIETSAQERFLLGYQPG